MPTAPEPTARASFHTMTEGTAEDWQRIVRPFVSELNHWMVAKHFVFQGYYYFHHLGADRNLRERHRDSPFFDHTAEFCEQYDQRAFDPAGETLPLAHFDPAVRRVFAPRPEWPGF